VAVYKVKRELPGITMERQNLIRWETSTMMQFPRLRPAISLLVLLLTAAACGGGNDRNAVTGGSSQASRASGEHGNSQAFAFTEQDLEGYERGLRREIDLVRAAQAKVSAAENAQERGRAIQAQFETATIPDGAQSAGLPPDRYRQVRQTVNRVFQTLDFQGKIDGPLEMDMSRVSAEQREELSRDPFEQLAPESAAALRVRMDRLVPIWIEYVRLTAVAG
jgi:hypothetical protein